MEIICNIGNGRSRVSGELSQFKRGMDLAPNYTRYIGELSDEYLTLAEVTRKYQLMQINCARLLEHYRMLLNKKLAHLGFDTMIESIEGYDERTGLIILSGWYMFGTMPRTPFAIAYSLDDDGKTQSSDFIAAYKPDAEICSEDGNRISRRIAEALEQELTDMAHDLQYFQSFLTEEVCVPDSMLQGSYLFISRKGEVDVASVRNEDEFLTINKSHLPPWIDQEFELKANIKLAGQENVFKRALKNLKKGGNG